MHRASAAFLALASFAYILGSPAAGAAGDHPPKPPPPPGRTIIIGRHVTPKTPVVDWIVHLDPGEYRAKEEEAKSEVLKKACDQVAALVKEYHPDSNWQPSKRFLKNDLKCSDPEVSIGQDTSEVDQTKSRLYNATVRMELTPAAREKLFRIVRLEEARERQWQLSKGLMVILAIIIAVAGYLRLSERVSSARSFALQCSAVAFVVVAICIVHSLP